MGATLSLEGTSSSAVADEDGNVLLTGIDRATGVLRARHRSPDTGELFERVFDLRLAGVRPGRAISLGTVALGRRATLLGYVRRGDVSGGSGHSGIRVFVASTPLQTTTADDGFFVLQGVPPGDLTLSAFAAGYSVATSQLEVRAGEERKLDLVVLAVSAATGTGKLKGRVVDPDGQALSQAAVTLDGTTQKATVTVTSDGQYEFPGLRADVVSLGFTAPGHRSLRLENIYFPGADLELLPTTLIAGQSSSDGGSMGNDGGTVILPGQAVERISVNGGLIAQQPNDPTGAIPLPIPGGLSPDDLVVLILYRYASSAPETIVRSSEWTLLGSQVIGPNGVFGPNCVEVATRRATLDEATAKATYTMHAAQNSSTIGWALVVYRNVESALLVYANTETLGPSGVEFAAQPTARGDRLLSVASFYEVLNVNPCSAPPAPDGGVSTDDAMWWWYGVQWLSDVGSPNGGTLPRVVAPCDTMSGVKAYTSFQVRLNARR